MTKTVCPCCGMEIDRDALFCPYCGKTVAAASVQGQPNQTNSPESAGDPAASNPQTQQATYPPYGGQPYQPYQSPCPTYTYAQPYPGQAPYSRPYSPVPPGYRPRNRIAAGVLALLVGVFGVHNFYLGFTGRAIAQLLMTIFSCGILGVVSYIWSLVEGIQILTGNMVCDARGVPMVQ